MDINFNMPSIIAKRNVDSEQNPISVKILETKQVMDNHYCVVLSQLPDENNRLLIEGFTEIFDIEKLDKKNYKVDYAQGVVYFHPKAVGKVIVVEYYGTGYELLSASRIFTKVDRYGNILETLEELIEGATECLELIKTLGDAVKVINKLEEDVASGNRLHDDLVNDIEVGTPLHEQLDGDIKEASKWKDQLHQDVADGKVLQPLLQQTVNDAEDVKVRLDQSIADAQDDIAIIEATGNKEVLIQSSEWALNGDVYEKQITHTLNSENLHVTAKNSDTKEAVTIGYKIINKTTILLKSDEAINMSVVLSASYYHATQTISDNVAEEVVKARKGEVDLKTKIDGIDEQLDNNTQKLQEHILNHPSGSNGSGLQKIVVKNIITTPSLISVGDVVLSNGFYSECDMPPMFYKCKSLDNTENFADIGNGIFVGQDCSIKIDGTKKITPLSKDIVHISQIGGMANNTSIRNEICINAILKNYITCSLGAGTYTIKGSIIHQSNSKLLGLGLDVTAIKMADGINQYPIKSHSCDLSNFIMLSNNLTLDGFTLNGNCSNNGVRNYSGNVYETYWGFGMMLCNIANLNISNVRCIDIEAWAISYWLCGTVIVNNLEFNQDETRVGYNGDGITGSAKRVNISNVTGFTNDDMVGVTTGSASLRGNDCGIGVNIDIDYINIKNVYNMSKNDVKSYTGVGVYLDCGAKISKVTIDNIKGEYASNAISIADYWTTDNVVNTKISSINIKNVCAEHSHRGAIHILAVEIDDLEICDVITNGINKDDLGVIELDNSKIKRLSACNITTLRTTACGTTNVIKSTNNTTINTLKINGAIIDDGGNSATLMVIKGGSVNNIIYNNVSLGRTYSGNTIQTDSTGFNLICDKMNVSADSIVPYGGVTTNSISAKVIGNSLNIVFDAFIQVDDVNLNYDLFDLSKLKFLLDKTYITSANLGGQPSSDCKPIFTFVYDNINKKIILQTPSLNGNVSTGKLRTFAQISIPLA